MIVLFQMIAELGSGGYIFDCQNTARWVPFIISKTVTDDPVAAHDAVAELCQRHPERFRGIANLSPLWDEADYWKAATHYVRDLDFVALKLNPMQHLTSPLMANADKVFRAGADLGVPVIVHTGLGAPWSLPSLCIPPARRYPDLPIVLAHAGFAIYTDEAYVAASECPNIYLEPSWCMVGTLQHFVRKLGAKRVLFGSDWPANVPVELAKYRAASLSDEDLATCLGGTAARIFRLK